MSFHSRTSKINVGGPPSSPQRDTTLSSGSTSSPADAPHMILSSGRILQPGWEHIRTTLGQGKTPGHAVIMDILPDDVFLRVFDFCSTNKNPYNWWHALVHVCRRWRQIILESPRRLNLCLLCTCKTPVRKNLGLWPTIPIAIYDKSSIDPTDEDNIFAALEYRNRIHRVTLYLTRSQLEKVAMAMRVPFPALSHLRMSSHSTPSPWSSDPSPASDVLALPDGFLGGNASSLQEISLTGISFPALPALLLSAYDLVNLYLDGVFDLPVPGTLAASLAATTRLEDLFIEFKSTVFPPSQRSETPPSRAVLPALTMFQFGGDYTYLEDLVAQIDCPQLRLIDVRVFYADEALRSSQLFEFIGRSKVLKLAPFRCARVDLYQISIDLNGSQAEPHPSRLRLEFPWRTFQVIATTQFLLPASAMLTAVRHLSVHYDEDEPLDYMADWIEFFHLFPAVETLHVGELVTTIGPVLNEITGAGVLAALRFLNLDGRPTRSVRQFISARQVSDFPVTLVKTREEFKMHEACCETVGVVDKHTA